MRVYRIRLIDTIRDIGKGTIKGTKPGCGLSSLSAARRLRGPCGAFLLHRRNAAAGRHIPFHHVERKSGRTPFAFLLLVGDRLTVWAWCNGVVTFS